MHRKLVGSEVQNQEVAYCCLVGNLGSCRPCVQLSQLTSRRDQVYSCSCDTPRTTPLQRSKNRAFRTARPRTLYPQRGGRGTCMACHCCTTWNLLPNKSNNLDDCEEQERSYNGGGAPYICNLRDRLCTRIKSTTGTRGSVNALSQRNGRRYGSSAKQNLHWQESCDCTRMARGALGIHGLAISDSNRGGIGPVDVPTPTCPRRSRR
jgi:hypothetical protein